MNLFLQNQVDAAAAMTYNELAQVLETENPDTGQLYTLDDLNVITMEDAGTAMLEDGVFVRGDWIADEANQDIATRFLKATFQGWIYCRDNPDECLQIVLDNGPTLGEGHQRWQLNEINALIWPTELGIGIMDPDDFQRTADIAQQFGGIKKPATDAALHDRLRRGRARRALGRGRKGRRLEEGGRRGHRRWRMKNRGGAHGSPTSPLLLVLPRSGIGSASRADEPPFGRWAPPEVRAQDARYASAAEAAPRRRYRLAAVRLARSRSRQASLAPMAV